MSLLAHPLRLGPGADLRAAVEAAVAAICAAHGAWLGGQGAAFVLQGIGSLSVAQLRFAGMPEATELRGDLEILSLAGSVSPDGAHLHMSVSDAGGHVSGGHVAAGCIVRTTAELVLALLPGHAFTREMDPASGYKELVVRSAAGADLGARVSRWYQPTFGISISKSVTPTSAPACDSRVVAWPRWWVWWLKKCISTLNSGLSDSSPFRRA